MDIPDIIDPNAGAFVGSMIGGAIGGFLGIPGAIVGGLIGGYIGGQVTPTSGEAGPGSDQVPYSPAPTPTCNSSYQSCPRPPQNRCN